MDSIEKIVIARPPEQLWEWIADPVKMMLWNGRIVGVERPGCGELRQGEEYHVRYLMARRIIEANVRVQWLDPPRELRFCMRVDAWPSNQCVYETWQLCPAPGGTQVIQHLDMGQSGMPVWVRWMMTLLNRLGRPVDASHLLELKRLAENPEALAPVADTACRNAV